MTILASCATLPSKKEVLKEGAQGPAVPKVKGPEGTYSKEESERILKRKAGNEYDAEHLKEFISAEEAITGNPLVAGNHVTLLVDGPVTYDSMLEAIRGAKDHVHLETYVLADDKVGNRFADAMLERAAAGVKCRVVYDSIGSFTISTKSKEYVARLRAGGIEVHEFHPVEDIRFWRFDNRDHRKLLVVDGKIAFTGGINITHVNVPSASSDSDPEEADEKTKHDWRDTHVRIEGPVVAEFQKLFLRIWTEGKKEDGLWKQPNLFPKLNKAGDELVRVISHTGGDKEYDIYKAYISAISHARERIWATHVYFLPSDQFLKALKDAAKRGVDVRIILPSFSDQRMVLQASQALYEDVLKSGIKIYEQKDRFVHAKTAVIDGIWSTVGSSNLDYMSFLHNNEVNAIIVGREFGKAMEELYLKDINEAHLITLEEWNRRPPWKFVIEKFSLMFRHWF